MTGAPHWLSASDIAKAYADRTLSPVELTQALLQRIEQLQPRLHAFIHLDAEAAMDAARTAEAELRAGRVRGPLHGIPVGIKDIIDVAGLPTTGHSKILVGNIAKQDAFCVSLLREAGAIVMGKLSTHEFAIGGPSFDLPFPPARNPWNRGIIPAARPPAPARASPPACSPSRWAPTPAARCAIPRASAASSASSRPTAWSAGAACFRWPSRWTMSAR